MGGRCTELLRTDYLIQSSCLHTDNQTFTYTQSNEVSVDAIKGHEEVETEFHAFFIPAIPGDSLSGRV